MKKKSILLIAILVIAIAAVTWYFKKETKPQPVSLITSKAQVGFIAKSITATGNVEPVDTVSVGAQVSGVVTKVYADFNSVVKQGQLLATVDPSILRAQVQEAKANLASARSNLQYQKNTYSRQSQLYSLGAISKADYQLSLNQSNSATEAVNNASAQFSIAEKNLSYTNIYSPINGVVLNRNVSAGQTIAASLNAPVLFVIAKDLTKMQVNANVDEADIGNVNAGQQVSFTVDAFPDQAFNGTVKEVYLHSTVSSNVVTYATLINVDNKDMKLKPGMTASINIYSEEDSNALLIPSRALSFKPDSASLKNFVLVNANRSENAVNHADKINTGNDSSNTTTQINSEIRKNYVWIKSGDTLTEKKIITGMNDDSNVKVLHGLSAGDEIITGIAVAGNQKTADNTQQSPFMPKMNRKPANTSRPK